MSPSSSYSSSFDTSSSASSDVETLDKLREECAALSTLYTSVDRYVSIMEERLEKLRKERDALMEASEDFSDGDELGPEELELERLVKKVEEVSKTYFKGLQLDAVEDSRDQDNGVTDNDLGGKELCNVTGAIKTAEEQNDVLMSQNFTLWDDALAQAGDRSSVEHLESRHVVDVLSAGASATKAEQKLLRKAEKRVREEGKKERRRLEKKEVAKKKQHEGQGIWRGCW